MWEAAASGAANAPHWQKEFGRVPLRHCRGLRRPLPLFAAWKPRAVDEMRGICARGVALFYLRQIPERQRRQGADRGAGGLSRHPDKRPQQRAGHQSGSGLQREKRGYLAGKDNGGSRVWRESCN